MKSVLAHPHIEQDGTWWNVGMGRKNFLQFFSKSIIITKL